MTLKSKQPKAKSKAPAQKAEKSGTKSSDSMALQARLGGIETKLAQILERLERGQSPIKAAPSSSPNSSLGARGNVTNDPGSADTAQFLSRTPLFAKLSPPECAVLASYCESKQVDAGQAVFSEGDFGDAMYIVKQGALNIFKRDLLGDVRIAEIRPGGLVGEMALVDGKPRSANVRASESSRLLSLSRSAYAELKKSHPAIATKFQDELLLLISSRLRQTTEKLIGK